VWIVERRQVRHHQDGTFHSNFPLNAAFKIAE
jgi:hypothetical protein